jgi:hypothetical protein
MEQIYTIPVNEAFEASRDDPACGCPMCAIYRKLEENELDLILGASMMEPEVRIKTNEQGFCKIHYDMMFTRKNRLGMALTLESHLNELRKDIRPGILGSPAQKPIKRIGALEESCYICKRIDFHFEHMIETVVLLFDQDEAFPDKLKSQPYFCLPHYKKLLECAQRRLPKKRAFEFSNACAAVTEPYFDALRADVSWFCKKFDYRYNDEPWGNSKDAVERAIKFLRSDLHRADPKKKPGPSGGLT